MTRRLFAEHASDGFNEWMEKCVQDIGADANRALGDNLHALVLGGGYARGEGGVVRAGGHEAPYNDLDFVLVVHEHRGNPSGLLRPVSHRHEKTLGIDVDFSRPLTVSDVRQWPHWLMWSDLLAAHRVILGPGDILTANAPRALLGSPPLIEATRLLLNRGAGLLWSLRIARGLEGARDADFIRRNLHKCELAIGDSVIMAHGRHQPRYTGRDAILEELLSSDQAARCFASLDAYRAALAFRLEPSSAEASQPSEALLSATAERWVKAFVHLEQRRAERDFTNWESYARWDGIREASLNSLAEMPRNLVRNARLGRLSARYPRERLLRTLPGLLLLRGSRWDTESSQFLREWGKYN